MDRILIVDDDSDLRGVLRDVLEEEGFAVSEAKDGRAALKAFSADRPDAVLLDLNMPVMDGFETMQELRKVDDTVPVIIVTAFGDVPTAVGMIKKGAYDFTLKPPEFERLIITLRKAVESRKLFICVKQLDTQLDTQLEDRFGRSPAARGVIKQIKQIGRTDISVIIQGETGTGKTVAASVIHSMSARTERPFVHVDIGLIPDQLVESELFGYKKGAFTGAERDKKGYFESADRGTIFLDELENMSGHVQMKLLSVIERKVVYPLGGTSSVGVDIRVISATNSDIRKYVQERRFREDLFYRLGEFIITMPPLRERADDIVFFAERFIQEACSDFNKQVRPLAPDAVELLKRHHWPGNLRELKNVMKRAVLLTEGDVIGKHHIEIMDDVNGGACGALSRLTLKDAMRDVEFRLISEVLRSTGFNKSRAAEILDTSYTNLLAKIREYGIRVPEKPARNNSGG
ncbi:MAG: sigma-54 dependent transcriptional regulator [Nitrospiraceae bacterium]|nr:sigma-54 dependent transcriptional regulator [Nitrospiraceae bacterium]